VVWWGRCFGGGSVNQGVGRGVGRGVGPDDVGRDAVRAERDHDPLHWWEAQGLFQANTSVRELTPPRKRQGVGGTLQAAAKRRALTTPCDRPGANCALHAGCMHEACDP